MHEPSRFRRWTRARIRYNQPHNRATTSVTLSAATRLGPYEILAPVGAGGMGEVYKACDTRLDRTVAVKVLPQALAADAQFRDRFDREARAISHLAHPHICTLYDVGEQNGTSFLVMEYLEGETLADRLKGGALPLGDALKIAIEIADALYAAHRQGIIHRDLKPGNVMLTKGGAKLLDFGLAKTEGPSSAAAAGLSMLPTTPANLTAQGTILGTFQYMAPEQLEGEAADARTDIFAFGAILHEMLTGKKAFEGKSQASLITAIMSASPQPITNLAPAAPALLDRIVRACLARDPADRLQNAGDVVAALRWARETATTGSGAVVTRRLPRNSLLLAASIAAIAIGAAAAYTLARPPRAEPAVVQFELNPPQGRRFETVHAISPDARQIVAVVTDAQGATSLWLRRFDDDAGRLIGGTDGASFPFWSPDSRAVAFFAGGRLKRVDSQGGSPIAIADAPAARGGIWTEDGAIIFAPGNNDPLVRVSAQGGDATPFTTLASARGEIGHRFPFRIARRHFGYYAITRDPAENGVWAAPLAAPASPTRIVRTDSAAQFGGGWLFFKRELAFVAQRLDVDALRLIGDPVTVTANVAGVPILAARPISASDDGAVAFRSTVAIDREMIWMSRGGDAIGTALARGSTADPAVSPDGRRLAFTKLNPERPQNDLWVMNIERQTSTTIASEQRLRWPVWSPDSQRITFGAGVGTGGNTNLYDIPSTGGAKRATVPERESQMTAVGWTRDGKRFLWLQTDIAPRRVIKTIGPDAQPSTYFDPAAEISDARLSPDERWIAFSSNQSGRPEIYAIGFPTIGQISQISTAGGTQPRWRRDGRELFYLSADGKMTSVSVRAEHDTIDFGLPVTLFAVPVSDFFQYDVASDGQRFVVNSARQVVSAPLHVVLNWPALQKK